MPIKTYTTADGLPRDQINRIAKDSHGFLWFCTPEGLSRFDGYTFTNYTTNNGLPHRNINDVLETRNGIYLIATSNGISIFNPVSSASPGIGANSLQGPTIVTFHPNEKRGNQINVLFEDHAGRIWCGTEAGLYQLELAGQKWTFRFVDLGIPPGAWDDASVSSIAESEQGALWVGTGSGLYRYFADHGTERFSTEDGLPALSITALLKDRDGRLWAGTKRGLTEFAQESGSGRPKVNRVYTIKDGLPNNDVKSLFQSSDGHLWVGIFGGLSEGSSGSGEAEFRSYTTAQGLSGFGIFALAEDPDGNLWLGTESAGAMKIARSGFVTYSKADGLGSDRIAEIREDQSGDLYTVSSALNRWFVNHFDREKFEAIVPNLPRSLNEFGWGWKQIHFQDREGEWWIPTAHGLYRFPRLKDIRQLASVHHRAVYTTSDGLASDEIFRLFEDSRGDIWIATYSLTTSGLNRWERNTGKFYNYSATDERPKFGLVTGFCEDKAGNLWLSSNAGLTRFANGQFRLFTSENGLPAGWIQALYLDHASRLWVASGEGGVARIDNPQAEQPRFVAYTTAEGLSSNSAVCLTEDESGHVYIGTGRGLDRLDPATGHISHYSSADGLARGTISEAFRDRHGVLWFGSDQGLSRLVPEPDKPSAPPPILITALRVAGVAYPISEFGARELPKLQLETNQRDIQINFVGLSFRTGEVLRYQYKLEGADRDWITPSEQRSISYANLSPGNYRFLVRAITANGVQSSVPATVSFLILRPIWERWWFLSFLVLILATIVYAIHRNRIARFLQLERIRMRIATDLHDDIGASLSQIAIQSEVMRQRMNRDGLPLLEPLATIAETSREVVDSMSDIVWAINPKRDYVQDLSQRMRLFASDIFTAGNIKFVFRAPAVDSEVGPDVRRQVFLIFKECVNNMVRHSGCTEADIDLRIQGNTLQLCMSDNGGGLTQTQSGDGHGIASMRERATRLGGELSLATENGKGTTITLSIPLDGPGGLRWRR